MRSVTFLSALVGFAYASPVPQDIDFDGVDAAPNPSIFTQTELDALPTIIPYNPSTAISAVAAEITADPIPQTLGLTIRDIFARDPCAPLPTTPNVYNIDLSTPESFLADQNMAAVANGAITPSGYTNSFTNLPGAVSTNAYMGYIAYNTYDPAVCAAQCNSVAGCLAFNIFFEYDPIINPDTACPKPAATANIKCSFWGFPVTASTATNNGQWRNDFHVLNAGSNGYTANALPPIPGYTGPTYLDNAAINAPSDCNGHGTYMGYKLFTSGPFDVRLCSAACDAQTAYNLEHPPGDGSPPDLCRFFNTYLLAKNGVNQGQYCAMYTQPWDTSYATNTGQWRGSDHYTIFWSFSAYNTAHPGYPVCPADVAYLASNGAAFCSSYIAYTPPVTTATATGLTTATTTTDTTVTDTITPPTSYSTVYTTVTETRAPPARRSVAADADPSDYSINVVTIYVPLKTGALLPNATAAVRRRDAIPTPASIVGWDPDHISAACSQVATGVVTATLTVTTTTFYASTETDISTTDTTLATPVGTTTVTSVSTVTGVPGVVLGTPTAIVGDIVNGSPTYYDDVYFSLTLPFAIGAFGQYSTNVWLMVNGMVSIGSGAGFFVNTQLPVSWLDPVTIFGFWDDLLIYPNSQQGIYYQIDGAVGSRAVTFEYYTSAFGRPSEYYHFTMTFYENNPGVIVLKYYDIYQNGYSATVGAQSYPQFLQYSFDQSIITPGLKLTIDTVQLTITPSSF